MTISNHVLQFEALWNNSVSATTQRQKMQIARGILTNSLRTLTKETEISTQTIGEALRAIEQVLATKPREELRETGVLLIRALSLPGIIPTNEEEPEVERRLLTFLEKAAPDIWKRQIKDNRSQNFAKRRELESTHSEIMSEISILSKLPSTPDGFMSSRQEVLKAVNANRATSYLGIFGIRTIIINIKAIYESIELIRTSIDHEFWNHLERIKMLIEEQRAWISDNLTFLSKEYYQPYLDCAALALSGIASESRNRFICNIRSREHDEFYIERRMPLHDSNRLIRIQVPLLNEGPGIAAGVSIQINSKEQPAMWGASSINLGDIRPGDFAFSIEALIERPIAELTIHFTVSWGNYADSERKTRNLIARVKAQAQDVDWRALELREPYSTSIAEGGDFVGRQEKVASLSSRILKDKMQSSYITGQKRIGKSSLAHAVIQNIKQSQDSKNVHFLYLEYGEYAHTDPAETLTSLGYRIDLFLTEFLPGVRNQNTKDAYKGTLSPLSALSEKLLQSSPQSKFVVILDEFDEIPQELYRMGALAETFFANIRTLSAKRNLAFMLVGGENMPYIVSAQGDQLNKFIREGLNSFSRADEWDDFVQLVKHPVDGQLSWHESAVNQVFELSNGHPYYAKLLCGKVYSISVHEHDTEIAATEVRRAYHELITSLDVNAFAHLWKDSIQGRRDESEVISLQRCRVLVTIARIVRQGKVLNLDNIQQGKNYSQLQNFQIEPIINDFCRRGILEDKGGYYDFSLPMFKDWLIQSGLNKLIADTLGDDLAASLQAAEDRSFVSDSEIDELVQAWHLYRGMRIGVPDVRQWLHQVPRFHQQRLLFKLLKHLRFFSELEIREKLRMAHSLVLRVVPEFVRRSPSERRTDILVTYVDGPGKSGSYYASRYAEENIISADCVKDMSGFSTTLTKYEQNYNVNINGIVLVDDLVGTGKGLSENIDKFISANREVFISRSITVAVVVVCATKAGEKLLRSTLGDITKNTGIKIDMRICEPLQEKHFAFLERNGIWENSDEEAEAKALCLELGARLQTQSPLGFDGQGILVVFPNTVPNNTLPIIHDEKRGGKDAWRALFIRPKN